MKVSIDVDVNDLLEALTDDDLRQEIKNRDTNKNGEKARDLEYEKALLERAWRDLRGRCDSRALSEYMWEVLGKVL